MTIRPEILDELLASTDDPKEIFGAEGLLAALTAASSLLYLRLAPDAGGSVRGR